MGSAGAPLQVHPLGPVEQQQVKSVHPEGIRPDFGAQRLPRGNGLLAFSHRLPFVGQHLAKHLWRQRKQRKEVSPAAKFR